MAHLIIVFKISFFNSRIKKQENIFNNYKLFSIFLKKIENYVFSKKHFLVVFLKLIFTFFFYGLFYKIIIQSCRRIKNKILNIKIIFKNIENKLKKFMCSQKEFRFTTY